MENFLSDKSYILNLSKLNLSEDDTDEINILRFLLHEYNNKNSIFKKYFCSLPKTYQTHPIFFTENEKKLLKNSYFLKRVEKFNEELEQVYNLLKSSLMNTIDKDNFTYLYLTLTSRSFSMDKSEGSFHSLVPYGDMFNTNLDDRAGFWYYDEENNFIVEARRNISKNEEIFVTYSTASNSYFLLYYGFTIGNNDNISSLENFEIFYKKNLISKIKLSNPPNIKDYNLPEMRKYFSKNKDFQQNNIHIKNELKYLQIIKKNIEKCLNLYPTTIEVKFILIQI